MIDDDVLPFLLVHGRWLWIVALSLLSFGVVAAVLLARRAGANRRVRAKVRELDHAKDAIRGTLRGDGTELAATLEVELADHVPSRDFLRKVADSRRADAIWLDTDRGPVSIKGPVHVIVGSRAYVATSGVPNEISDEQLARLHEKVDWVHRRNETGSGQRATTRTLHAGDDVIATGTLTTVAGSEGTDYRQSASGLALKPGEGDAIQLAARTAARELPRFSFRLGVVLTFLAASVFGLGAIALARLGDRWVETCDGTYKETAPFVLTSSHVCSLAAATPGNSDDAMNALLTRIERVTPHSAQSRAVELAVSQRLESCGAVGRLIAQYRYADAVEYARRCNDPRTVHVALILDARFEEAAKVPVPATDGLAELPKPATLIAAGKWAEAAVQVDALASASEKKPGRESAARYHRCIAQLLRHHAGDPAALGRLRELHEQGGGVCSAMLAEIVPEDHTKLIDDYKIDGSPSVLRLLAWSEGRTEGRYVEDLGWVRPTQVLTKPFGYGVAVELPRAWLVEQSTASRSAEPWMRAPHVLAWRTIARALDGDLAAAKELAAQSAVAASAETARYGLTDFVLLPAVVALYTPTLDVPLDLEWLAENELLNDVGPLLVRTGRPLDGAYFGPNEEYKAAMGQARRGDGRALVRHIGGRNWWSELDVIGALPRLTVGREQVVQAIRYADRSWADNFSLDTDYPFNLVVTAFVRRELFKLAGLPDEAKRWDEMYRRLDTVFSDRKKLVALMLVGRYE